MAKDTEGVVYRIPPNFVDKPTVAGGMIRLRNLAEAAILDYHPRWAAALYSRLHGLEWRQLVPVYFLLGIVQTEAACRTV